MPERRWRYRRRRTVSWQCSTRGALSLRRKRRHVRVSCGFNGASPHTPTPHQGISGAGSHLRNRLASPEAVSVDGHARNADAPNSGGRVRKAAIISRRKPTPRQRARWQAVQRAKLNGLSIRGIARELGMHRDTVRRYMAAESPPMMRPRVKSGASQSDTMTNYSDGHFR